MTSRLSADDIKAVVEMLDGWVGKLSWDSLVLAIARRIGTRYSRQALDRHWQIKHAFQMAKERLDAANGQTNKRSVELNVMDQKIARLQAENERLRAESSMLIEQFHRWAYNAHSQGLTADQLNKPLPPIKRK